jgi:uncharacterized membrane protein YeiH
MVEQVLVAAGTVTFAVTGALVAVRKRFDLVGITILAVVTAVGGGSIRDVVAGIVPPTSLTQEELLWLPVVTGFVVAATHRWLPTGRTLYAADTISLALFAALGAERGIEVGFGFWGVLFAGGISGVGGGVIRDVLSGEVPGVLYRSGDLYASAAVGGAAVTYLLHAVDPTWALVTGAVTVVVLRVGSRLLGLQLPVPRSET